MITVLATVAFSFVALLVAGLAWRGRSPRTCPTCRTALVEVAPAAPERNATYDVLACVRCGGTHTLVQGALRDLAFCPRCRNRALALTSHRTTTEGLTVAVQERCHLCGYEAEHLFVGVRPQEARVLPFPGGPPRTPSA